MASLSRGRMKGRLDGRGEGEVGRSREPQRPTAEKKELFAATGRKRLDDYGEEELAVTRPLSRMRPTGSGGWIWVPTLN